MAEKYARCRFWPDCRIHLGQTPPRHFTAANARQMQADAQAGDTYRFIAGQFGTIPSTVAALVTGRRQARHRI